MYQTYLFIITFGTVIFLTVVFVKVGGRGLFCDVLPLEPFTPVLFPLMVQVSGRCPPCRVPGWKRMKIEQRMPDRESCLN